MPRKNLPADQRALLKYYAQLSEQDRASLMAFAEFLALRRPSENEDQAPEKMAPVEPKQIPRPAQESVIGAIKRLSETYPMLDRSELLTETSSLMSAHIMQGREAAAVIDDLEALFASHYAKHTGAGK